MRKWILGALIFSIGVLTFPFFWREALVFYYEPRIENVETAESAPVAIVFGARVYESGRLSGMLRDRVETAITLHEAGKVERILMSGGVSRSGVSEPVEMREYAIRRGVPPEAIIVDEQGLRTYDTCYWAQSRFGLERAILVSQTFHLPRVVFTCAALGIDGQGVAADRRGYHPVSLRWSEWREVPATAFALLDVLRQDTPQ